MIFDAENGIWRSFANRRKTNKTIPLPSFFLNCQFSSAGKNFVLFSNDSNHQQKSFIEREKKFEYLNKSNDYLKSTSVMVDADRRAALRDITFGTQAVRNLPTPLCSPPPYIASLLRLIEMGTTALLLLLFSIDIELKRRREGGGWLGVVPSSTKELEGGGGRRIIASF